MPFRQLLRRSYDLFNKLLAILLFYRILVDPSVVVCSEVVKVVIVATPTEVEVVPYISTQLQVEVVRHVKITSCKSRQ